ncbi:MAG: precorrin-8X methylmutase [Syntrophomonadaceae bacterium]|nr:precorrin-8X methylmutase [Syntrophomonadaceae bacterium]
MLYDNRIGWNGGRPSDGLVAKSRGMAKYCLRCQRYGAELLAPMALFEVLDMIEKGIARPALIIGTPVGFVGAAESKDLMVEKNLLPYISVIGTRGGSPIAVSIINALLYYEGGNVDG